MTPGAVFWLLLFACSALIFFGIAIVVSVRGVGDLRDLLGTSERRTEST